MALTTKERALLKSKCNPLKASVNVGKGGLTDNVLGEISMGLYHNELVKVNVLKSSPDNAATLLARTCEALECEPVTRLGNKYCVYKRSDKEDVEHLL